MAKEPQHKTAFESGSFTYGYENSASQFSAEEMKGMVTVESLVEAIYTLGVRLAIQAQGTFYRRKVKSLKQQLEAWVAKRAVAKVAEKAAVKSSSKILGKLTSKVLPILGDVYDAAKSRADENDLELSMREAGIKTFEELAAKVLLPDRHRHTKTIYSRKHKETVIVNLGYLVVEVVKGATEKETAKNAQRAFKAAMKNPDAYVEKMKKLAAKQFSNGLPRH